MAFTMRNERKHQAWNFWSAFVFLGAVWLVAFFLQRKGIDIRDLTLKEALLIILSTTRLTRILVFEKILKHFRDALKRRQHLYVIGTIHSMVTCPWCAGVWMTLIIVVFYYLIPYGELLIYVLALSILASMVILVSNLLHMYTERRQRIHQKEKYPDHL
jgi:hypothetical protein